MLSLVRLDRASQEGDVWADMSPEGHEINQVDIWEHQLTSSRALVQEFSMSTEDASTCEHQMGGKGRKKLETGHRNPRNQSVQGLVGFRKDWDPVLSKKECYCGGVH